MFTRRTLVFLAALTVFTLAPFSVAKAQTLNLGDANDFNVFVFGDHNQTGTDTEGRVAVGGNATYDNGSYAGMTIASKRNGSTTDNLIVAGNYTNRNNTVYGNAVIGGNTTWTTPSVNGNLSTNGNLNLIGDGSVNGTIQYGNSITGPGYLTNRATKGTTALPINFGLAQTTLSNLSSSLATYTTNGATNVQYGGITMTGNSNSLNVFSLDASQLSGANGLNINAAAGSTVLINVTGTAATFTNFQMNINGTDKRNVLFNFKDATQISLQNFMFNGSILATKANVNTTYGQLNGTLVANSLAGSMESHDYTFTGNLSNGPSKAIPEAGTVYLLGLGLLCAGGMLRQVRHLQKTI